MPIEAWIFAAIAGAAIAVGISFRPRTRSRLPCPHCGKRTSREPVDGPSGMNRLRPGTLIYRCSECQGEMCYARRPTGQEYWAPIAASPPTIKES